MTNTPDTRPTVSPIEGHYALLRNGIIAKIGEKKPTVDGLELFHSVHFNYRWFETGKSTWSDGQYDIISTIRPDIMLMAAKITMPFSDITQEMLFNKQAQETARLEALIPLADAACDYADAHCRAFPIATALKDREIEVFDVMLGWHKTEFQADFERNWPMTGCQECIVYLYPTHWRPLPPPPSNPPLPAVFVELGQALERLKEGR